jgi:hypothetical protein
MRPALQFAVGLAIIVAVAAYRALFLGESEVWQVEKSATRMQLKSQGVRARGGGRAERRGRDVGALACA